MPPSPARPWPSARPRTAPRAWASSFLALCLPRSLLPSVGSLAALLAPLVAHADCEPRPTDTTSTTSYSFEGAPVARADGKRCIVWYATSGKHAPDLTASTPPTPDVVQHAVQVVDDALDRYEQMGFRTPPDDGGSSACAGNPDGRLDVYLLAFTAADGLTVPERCSGSPARCASFVVAERAPEQRGYASFDEGARTILPHEAFHAVQNAYDVGVDRYWAEGSAQWATAVLHPDLHDLARLTPGFLDELDRPLDLPPAGVTASFLYGSALWPVFLAQRFGPTTLVATMDAHGAASRTSFEAVDVALAAHGTSVADEFPLFSAWNAATGDRSRSGQGYASAPSYPAAPLSSEAPDGLLAGFSARLHRVSLTAASDLALTADTTRLAASWLPLTDGHADLAHLAPLPTKATGEGIVVVAGRSTKKSDASYHVAITAAPAPTTPPTPTTAPTTSAPPTTAPPAEPTADSDSGCSVPVYGGSRRTSGWLLALALVGARRRRPPPSPP